MSSGVDWARPCDFCASGGAVVFYECPRMRVRTPLGEIYYPGPWPACPACRALIDSEQWHALIAYCVRRHLRIKPGADPHVTFECYAASIDAFRSARIALGAVRAIS